jgi:hypothetical protein
MQEDLSFVLSFPPFQTVYNSNSEENELKQSRITKFPSNILIQRANVGENVSCKYFVDKEISEINAGLSHAFSCGVCTSTFLYFSHRISRVNFCH